MGIKGRGNGMVEYWDNGLIFIVMIFFNACCSTRPGGLDSITSFQPLHGGLLMFKPFGLAG